VRESIHIEPKDGEGTDASTSLDPKIAHEAFDLDPQTTSRSPWYVRYGGRILA